jgi:hypothetical protein
MARVTIALLFFLISNDSAQAQSGWEYLDQTPERSVGLLDLPDIVGQGCGASDKRATARVSGSPSEKAAHVGTIYMRDEGDAGCGLMIERTEGLKEDVPTLESGYEIGAARSTLTIWAHDSQAASFGFTFSSSPNGAVNRSRVCHSQ